MDYKDAVELQKYRTCGAVDDVIRDQRTLSAYTQLGTIDDFRAFIREKQLDPKKKALAVKEIESIIQNCITSVRNVIIDPCGHNIEVADLMRSGIMERQACEYMMSQSPVAKLTCEGGE